MTGSFSTTFRVGRKYWCTATYPAADDADGISALGMQWSPRPPRRLTRAERRDWLRGMTRADNADLVSTSVHPKHD